MTRFQGFCWEKCTISSAIFYISYKFFVFYFCRRSSCRTQKSRLPQAQKKKRSNDFCCEIVGPLGPSGENRTHGLLNPIVLLSKTQCTIRYCLDSVSLNFKFIIPFCFIGCQDVSFLLWSNCGQTNLTNDLSPPAKLHRAISIFINRSCAFCLHELSIRRICQPCQ